MPSHLGQPAKEACHLFTKVRIAPFRDMIPLDCKFGSVKRFAFAQILPGSHDLVPLFQEEAPEDRKPALNRVVAEK
jgi:hypothetical protein